jgi:hypothetical protein
MDTPKTACGPYPELMVAARPNFMIAPDSSRSSRHIRRRISISVPADTTRRIDNQTGQETSKPGNFFAEAL